MNASGQSEPRDDREMSESDVGKQPIISKRFDDLGLDDPKITVRLGIMGGTFNPIHFGHLLCAEEARVALKLDAVLFMPTGNPSFKRDKAILDAARRVDMIRLAIADNPSFDVSLLEVKRPGITYTLDTLKTMRKHYPDNVSFFFITGADSVRDIPSWHKAAELADLATFVGVGRPGYDLEAARTSHMNSEIKLDVMYLGIDGFSISSTDLRKRIGAGRSIRYRTPTSVCTYIADNGLYEDG